MLVCTSMSYKIVADVRNKTKREAKEPLVRKKQPFDPLARQLHEFTNARFGREMIPDRVQPQEQKKQVDQTWPVLRIRKSSLVSETRKKEK